jgi:hypothetical protein
MKALLRVGRVWGQSKKRPGIEPLKAGPLPHVTKENVIVISASAGDMSA